MEKNYILLALKKLLNVKSNNSLFVVLSSDDEKTLSIIMDTCDELRFKDVYYEFYDEEPNRQKWGEYIEKGANFLFIINDNFNNTFSQTIMEAFTRNEIDISYTVIPTFDKLKESSKDISFLKSNNYIEKFNDSMRDLSKLKNKLLDYNLKKLLIKSYGNVEIEADYNNTIIHPLINKKLTRYPNYPLELVFDEESCNGYINAAFDTYIHGERIKDLRVIVKDGHVIDYDCVRGKSIDFNKVVDFFKGSKKPKIYSLGINYTCPSFMDYNLTNNFVIDEVNTTYILIKDNEGSCVYLPIRYQKLYVDAVSKNGDIIELYDSSKMDNKVYSKKLLK